jgi:hypothetical protein
MDLYEILAHFSVTRPNQGQALEETAKYIQALLSGWGIQFAVQEFTLRPYMQLLVGITILLLAILLFILVLKKKSLSALIVCLVIPLLLIAEFELFIPVVSGIIQKTGQNIILTFDVPNPARDLIFAAHYDSKTDFWDHIQRARIYAFIPVAIGLGLIVAVFTFFSRKYASLKKKAVTAAVLTLAGIVVVYWGLVFLGFGGYIFLPIDRQSRGSVDDGGSVVALLALSKDIHDGKVNLGNSRVTILLTSGEEVNLQGADRYVQERFYKGEKPALPVSLVNLELVGQNGPMIYWKKDGEFLKFYDADPGLINRVGEAWKTASGKDVEPGHMFITDDAQRFLTAGIPAVTIGNSGLPGLGEAGFHCTADNPGRVNVDNLKLMVMVLERYIEGY